MACGPVRIDPWDQVTRPCGNLAQGSRLTRVRSEPPPAILKSFTVSALGLRQVLPRKGDLPCESHRNRAADPGARLSSDFPVAPRTGESVLARDRDAAGLHHRERVSDCRSPPGRDRGCLEPLDHAGHRRFRVWDRVGDPLQYPVSRTPFGPRDRGGKTALDGTRFRSGPARGLCHLRRLLFAPPVGVCP